MGEAAAGTTVGTASTASPAGRIPTVGGGTSGDARRQPDTVPVGLHDQGHAGHRQGRAGVFVHRAIDAGADA
jgi:hypothetical protein